MVKNTARKPSTTRLCMNPSILFVIISLMIVSPLFSGEPDKKLHEKCIYPTVLLTNGDNSGSCSGAILRSEKISDSKYHNVVVSTSHGVSSRTLIVSVASYINWSEIVKTTVYPAIVYYDNPNADLCVSIFASDRKMSTVDLATEEKLYIGNKVIRVGCGLGDSPRLEEGILTAINMRSFRGRGRKVHRMSIYTLPGDSGGPVFEDYKLIGWTQSIRSISTNPFIENTFYRYALAIRAKDLFSMVTIAEGGLDFLTNKQEPLPILWYFKLKTAYLSEEQRVIPAHPWIDN